MRVKMLVDAPGSPDGVTVNEYVEGDVYEVPDDLGETFVKYDLADETTDDVTGLEPLIVPSDEDAEDEADADSKKVSEPTENK